MMSKERKPFSKMVNMPASMEKWDKSKIFKNEGKEGKIVTFGIWFPNGSGNLVKVRFDIGGQKIPEPSQYSDDYYVGDDVRYPLLVNVPISRNTEITIEYQNTASVPKQVGVTWEYENTPLKHRSKSDEELKAEKEEEEDRKAEEKREKDAVDVKAERVKKMPNIPVVVEKKKVRGAKKGKTSGGAANSKPAKKVKPAPRIVKKMDVKGWIDDATNILGGDE